MLLFGLQSLWAALVLQCLLFVSLGSNWDRGVKIFGTQEMPIELGGGWGRHKYGKRKTIGKKNDRKETRERWKNKLGKHLLCLRHS